MSLIYEETIIEGQKIFYGSDISDDFQPLTVFFHGWGSFGDSFSRLFDAPQNILAFDFPNAGKSSPLQKSFSLEDYTRITQLLIEKIQKKYPLHNQKIILVGHSFGGRVISKLLTVYPEKFSPDTIEKVIYIAVPFYREQNIKTHVLSRIGKVVQKILPDALTPFFQKIFHSVLGGSDYVEISNNPILKKTFQNIINEEISGYLEKLSNYNTFCFWGENDDVIPISFAFKAKKEKISALEIFSIPSAGHFPWIDNTEYFLQKWNPLFREEEK